MLCRRSTWTLKADCNFLNISKWNWIMPNRRTHRTAGVLGGGALALITSHGQHPLNRIIETVGGSVAGGVFGELPDIIEPAIHPRHRRFAHSATTGIAMTAPCAKKLEYWQKSLRGMADEHAILKTQSLDELDRLWHAFLELFFRILAGFIAGAVAGYASHLILDALTPMSLPLVV